MMSSLIIGNPSEFAIESGITKPYPSLSQRALGFFLIHLDGIRYGIQTIDATLLACSFDAINRRISQKGQHTAKFSAHHNPLEVANAVRRAIYFEVKKDETEFGMSASDFKSSIIANEIVWAPDGDAAFDDGSHVLQFDINEKVRLIGFKNTSDFLIPVRTASDIWLDSDLFYGLLSEWYEKFEAEWLTALKV